MRLLFISLSLLLVIGAAHAQFSPWKAAPLADTARLDASASKIAFFNSSDGHLTVHRLGPSATLGARLWASPPTDKITGFCWWGTGLLVSRTRGGRGETVRILLSATQPDGKSTNAKTLEKVILPVAGRFVAASPQGNVIAVTPLNAQKTAATIEFYRRGTAGNGAIWTKSATYAEPCDGGFESFLTFNGEKLYVLEFAADGSGLFAVVPDPSSRGKDRMLALVTPPGKAFALTSGNAPFIPDTADRLPLISPLKRGTWSALGISTLVVAPFGLLDSPRAALPRGLEFVAWLPDGQKQLFQNVGPVNGATNEAINENGADLLVADIDKKQRASLPAVPLLSAAAGWVGPRLVVRTGQNRWGALMVAPQNWERMDDASTRPKAPQTEVVEEFLRRSDIAKPENVQISTDSSVQKGVFSFRLAGSMRFDGVKVDEIAHRVVEFRGPDPLAPLPPQPIPLEVARQNAGIFARSLNPSFFEGQNPEVSVGELTELAAFPVRFSRSATDWIEVGVRGGDGKIGSYREAAFLPEFEKERLARGEKERPTYATPTLSNPQISPDGSLVAFSWTQPTPGYPAWWRNRPPALWVVKTSDGKSGTGKPRVLATEVSSRAVWSPDSRNLAFMRRGEIGRIEVATNQVGTDDIASNIAITKNARFLAAPPTQLIEDLLIGWKNNRELLLGWMHNGPGSTDLLSWDGLKTPQIVVRDWTDSMGNEDGLRGAALSPDGGTMAVLFERDFQQGTKLFLIPIADLGAKPQKFEARVEFPFAPVWTSAGIFSSSRDGASRTDPRTGQSARWSAPQSPGISGGDFSISADGKKVAFLDYTQPKSRNGWTLFVSDFNGQNARPVIDP